MFAQLRRIATRKVTTTPLKRKFGGHHHEETMSTHSELPAGDWRNRPMNFDFTRTPTSPYETFVRSHLSGPEDPALKLNQGQFIVYMRRLAREEFGYEMYTGRLYMAMALFGVVCLTNVHWNNTHDIVNTTFAQRQYSSIFDKPVINGPNFEVSTAFRQRLDEFFGEHDEATIAKLPKELQQIYNDNKEEYNSTYASQGDIIALNENLAPQNVAARKEALKVKFGLNDQDIQNILKTCDQYTVIQQAFEADDAEMAKYFPTVSKVSTV